MTEYQLWFEDDDGWRMRGFYLTKKLAMMVLSIEAPPPDNWRLVKVEVEEEEGSGQ